MYKLCEVLLAGITPYFVSGVGIELHQSLNCNWKNMPLRLDRGFAISVPLKIDEECVPII
jgi:hypothetical protein